MASIIYVSSKNNSTGLSEEFIQTLRDLSPENLVVIGDSGLEAITSQATLIPYESDNLSQSMKEALRVAKSDRVVILNSESELNAAELKKLLAHVDELDDQSIAYAQSSADGDGEDFSTASMQTLLQLISYETEWSISAIAAKKSLVSDVLNSTAESAIEILARVMISAVGNNYSIATVEPVFAKISADSIKLSKQAASRCLNMITNCAAIEELFPEHAWEKYSEESAAACYHSLAAMFIRLGDDQSAIECIRVSEQFEESPRSWALKGLIAFNKGETLGAVANLVSSLQQYEERKKSDTHYVIFAPKDLEEINSSLVSGLDALNKRDNEKALDFFARAVFNFDDFFARYGLDRTKNQ